MQKQSQTVFWLKHLALALLVIVVAVIALLYQPSPSTQSIASSAQSAETRADISSNLTKFYEEFRMSSRERIDARYGDYVIPLEMPSDSVAQQLIKIGNVRFPPQDNWQGSEKVRAFPKDSTLRTEALKYVEEENMTLIWDLNQDFIIRGRFQSFNTLIGTIDEIGGAVDSNFPGKVRVYLCHKKRTLVITSDPQYYVEERCQRVTADEY